MRRNKLPIFRSAPLVLSATTTSGTAAAVLPTLIILSAITIPVAMLIVSISENAAINQNISNTSINQNTSSTLTPSPSSTPTPSPSGNAFQKSEPVSNFSSYINKILSSAFSFVNK
jgi:hypothetical protein